jgi:hypothetical protein
MQVSHEAFHELTKLRVLAAAKTADGKLAYVLRRERYARVHRVTCSGRC